MYDICLFAGTSEGRRLVEALQGTSVKVYVCVATEYGETLLPKESNIVVHTGRFNKEQMMELFAKEQFSCIVDATHPFAVNVTENIRWASKQCGIEYIRLLRNLDEQSSHSVYVESIAHAAAFLQKTEGNILVTTGSKELMPYTEIPNYQERIYARVLPMQSSLLSCENAGLQPSHIIAMQGPFSREINRALLQMTHAKYLVTKDSGENGGFPEKIYAAEAEGVTAVIIGRPREDQGMEYSEVIRWLMQRYRISFSQTVSLIGIGMGAPEIFTEEAKIALEKAECIIGAKRAVEACGGGKPCFCSMDNGKILEFIRLHPEYQKIAVVMTGDTGFFSGAKKLLPLLEEYQPKIYPGISSLQYLCAKIGTSWDDTYILSLHGREGSVLPAVMEHEKVFVLVGGAGGVKRVLEELCENGLGDVLVYVGERLSYKEERIVKGTAEQLCEDSYDPLSVLMIQNDRIHPVRQTACLPDHVFIRSMGEGNHVPMTKAEIRAVSVAKLMLDAKSIVYDIGAGTGSVSVEMANICSRGHVYAVECKSEAAALADKNKKHFGLSNLTIIEGTAPEVCMELPAPTHAFIGGTNGNMYEILSMLLKKNPNVRIVINVIALESIAEAMRCIEEFSFDETEVVQISVAKAKKLGRYHLMKGQNPIMIITCQKHSEESDINSDKKGMEI